MAPPTPSRSSTFNLSAPTAPSRNNPISLRIYKALGTTFDDPSSREALEIAASFYAPKLPDVKGKQRALGLNGDVQPALDVAGENGAQEGSDEPLVVHRRTLKGQSAAMAREHLKRDVEMKLAESSQAFLDAFGEVDKKLQVLREHMQEMQVRCDQVEAELEQANSGTKYLLERAEGLRAQRDSAQLRSRIITLFLARFTLSSTELAALTSREIDVGKPVFDALDRVQAIRGDCRALLGGEEGKEQAGLDIMQATSEQMEAGYKKLYRWVQFELRQFTREGQLDVSATLREAVRRLRERQSMFRDAIQTLTHTRSSSLLQSFLDALTRGGPNGLPRPIEIHAHDPIRYVGDMLAWIHQATASEHEFLESLFGANKGRRMVGQPRAEPKKTEVVRQSQESGKGSLDLVGAEGGGRRKRDPAEEAEDMVRECLDKDLEGLARPLKLRIQQTIKSQEGIIMTYRIANLVQFYLVTMRRTIGEQALLCQNLQEIYDASRAAFLETLDAQGRSILRFLHPPDATLTPPLALRDATHILRDVIAVYETSLVDEADREKDFGVILGRAVDPAVEMCERMAEMKLGTGSAANGVADAGAAGGEWERDIFLINCLNYLLHSLEGYASTEARVDQLDEQISKHVESMTFEHHGKLLEQCGLAPIMRAVRTRPPDTPLSRLPATSPKALSSALAQFSSFLNQLDVLSSPRLALLTSAQLAEEIHRGALRKISDAYGEVCDLVLDKKEGYEFGETMVRRGRDEVAVALGVDEG